MPAHAWTTPAGQVARTASLGAGASLMLVRWSPDPDEAAPSWPIDESQRQVAHRAMAVLRTAWPDGPPRFRSEVTGERIKLVGPTTLRRLLAIVEAIELAGDDRAQAAVRAAIRAVRTPGGGPGRPRAGAEAVHRGLVQDAPTNPLRGRK